jgi:hypothetical protein
MKFFAALALVLLLSACNEFTAAKNNDHVGSYSMSSVNGSVLPFTISDENADTAVAVVSGTVTLNGDRTFTDRSQFRLVANGDTTVDEQVIEGRYVRSGGSVSLSGYDGSSYGAILDGTGLIVIHGPLQVSYTR